MNINVQYPSIDPAEGQSDNGIGLVALPKNGVNDDLVLAVVRKEFVAEGAATLQRYGRENPVFFDMKSRFPQDESDLRL